MSDETQFVKLSYEQLGRLTRKDPTELKEQLTKANPDTGETLSQSQQFEVISNHMTGHFKAVVEESRNRGGKEIIKSKMRQLADKYGLDSSGDLEDLIQSIEQKTIDSVKGDFSASDAFKMKEVSEKITTLQAALEAKENEIKSIKTGYQKEKVLSTVNSKAISILESKGAKFSTDPQIRERQIKAFTTMLSSKDYQILEDGEIQILNEDGLPLEDSNYNKIGFSDFVVKNSVVDFGDVINPKDIKAPNTKLDEDGGFDGFTKEELDNYSSIYMTLRGKGKHDRAARILEAGKKFKEQKNS